MSDYQLIPFEQLKISESNVSAKTQADPDFLERLHRSMPHVGIVQPLVVRANGTGYEIIAGRKRHLANGLHGTPVVDPVPCIIRDSDDFEASSVSLVENTHREQLDPISEHEAYAALVKQRKSEQEIAEIFGVEVIQVKRSLALAKLAPEIKKLYREQIRPCASEDDDDELDPPLNKQELQALTLATKKRQKEFYNLFTDPSVNPWMIPRDRELREWALQNDNETIPVARALFDPAEYKGAYVNDLFAAGGQEFADAAEFWRLQNQAIEAKRQAYEESGKFAFVKVVPLNDVFLSFDWRGVDDDTGGVVIDVQGNGEIEIHEHVVPIERGGRSPTTRSGSTTAGDDEKPKRAELSQESVNYVQLRKLATVRAELLNNPMVAIRVLLANALSYDQGIQDPRVSIQADHSKEIEDHAADVAWHEARRAVAKKVPADRNSLSGGWTADCLNDSPAAVWKKLTAMTDEQILTVLACLATESLGRRSELVDDIGMTRELDLTDQWDNVAEFLEGVRDKEALQAMLKEVAGANVMKANGNATGKQLRQLILEHAPADWRPRYFKFPAKHYTKRVTAL